MILTALALSAAAATVTVGGDCPGLATFTITGTPGAQFLLLAGRGVGSTVIPGPGSCSDLDLDLGLSTPIRRFGPFRDADFDGEVVLRPSLPDSACDSTFAVLDLSACEVSPPATLAPEREGRLVFLSSELFDGDFGGALGADLECQRLADAAGLGGTYMAWLGDSTTSPNLRFSRDGGPFVLLDGTEIATDWADLTDGTLASPITLTELGGAMPASYPGICGFDDAVWSGADAYGDAYDNNCGNWTGSGSGSWGKAVFYDFAAWSWANTCTGGACDALWQAGLYCFEQ